MTGENGQAFLQGAGIMLRFGGVTALRDVSFAVKRGSLHTIIGPNGAGKTSLFNVITGLYRMNAGDVHLDGRRISFLPPHEVARAGIVRTFQNLELFGNMTALENVLTGGHLLGRYGTLDWCLRTRRFRQEEAELRARAEAALAFVGLSGEQDVPAANLPFGSARLLEIARALCAEPKILLLDEPAAGLNLRETAVLGDIIRRIVERGITAVMVDHDMDLVMRISDHVLVLNYGEVIAQGTPAEVQRNPAVIAAYLGEEQAACSG
jgi:ABC-type branched-subunit amino acid transport system ATPase component